MATFSSLPTHLNTLEANKFDLDQDGEVVVKTKLKGLAVDREWDYFAVEYPTATKELYKFYTGGSGGTLQITIELNYTNSTKDVLSNGVKTYGV